MNEIATLIKGHGLEFFYWCERRFKLIAILVLILLLIPAALIIREDMQPYIYYVKSYIFGVITYSALMSIMGVIFVFRSLKKGRIKQALSTIISVFIVSIPWLGALISQNNILQ